MTVIATVEIDLELCPSEAWVDEVEQSVLEFDSEPDKVLSKEISDSGIIKYKLLKEYKFESFGSFISDLENEVEENTFEIFFTIIEGYRIKDVRFEL